MKTTLFLALTAISLMLTGCAKNCECDFTDDGILHISFETLPELPTVMTLVHHPGPYILYRIEINEENKNIEMNLNAGNYLIYFDSYRGETGFQIQAKESTYIHFSDWKPWK